MTTRAEFENLPPEEQRHWFILTTEERKQVCKELKLQAKGIIPPPIKNMTLNKYFKLIKESMFALANDNGIYRTELDRKRGGLNLKKTSARNVAKMVMDGRMLFHSDYGNVCGILDNINPNDPKKFLWWTTSCHFGGHPWEAYFGCLVPRPILKNAEIPNEYSNKWILFLPPHHRCTPFSLRVFLRLRKLGFPVIWQMDEDYEQKLLSKKYFVDLTNQPNWLEIDEIFFKKQKEEADRLSILRGLDDLKHGRVKSWKTVKEDLEKHMREKEESG